jgi:acetylornithine deacetylase/succinyl-diaminopimelate desuccinylase-like protein
LPPYPLQAVEAYLKTSKTLPVNVKFLLEGQEEVGSPQLREFLEDHKEMFSADVALSADGGQISSKQPGISTGLR